MCAQRTQFGPSLDANGAGPYTRQRKERATSLANRNGEIKMAITKTQVRKLVGRGKFEIEDFAEATEVSKSTARRRVLSLVDEGILEQVGTAKRTNGDGEATRGRPAHLYRLVQGSSN